MMSEQRFGRYFLMVIFVISFAAFFYIIRYFLIDIILAAVFATLFYPLYKEFMELTGNRSALSSLACCLIFFLVLVIPVVIIINIVVAQAAELYSNILPALRRLIEMGQKGMLGRILPAPLLKILPLNAIDWQTVINNIAEYLGVFVAKIINAASRATVGIIIDVFIIIFSLFYFLKDGNKIIERLSALAPLNEEYKEMLIMRFRKISSGTLKGIILISLIQSFLGTMILWIFGVSAWLLWGIVMLIFAILPVIGTGFVLVPAGVIKMVSGQVWQGIAIIILSLFIVSSVDNLLRPRLVGVQIGMHDLLVFFSTLGGIVVFGASGFIIGPLITALFLTILNIYSVEFQESINGSKKAID